MRAEYRGYRIEVTRERCLGGWMNTYYSVFRASDGLEVVCDTNEAQDNIHTLVKSIVKSMRGRIDEFIATEGESEFLGVEFHKAL